MPQMIIPDPNTLATSSSPGAESTTHFAILEGMAVANAGVVPAFAANAATINPGTDACSSYTIESARTVAADSVLTVSVDGPPVIGPILIECRAKALGHKITLATAGTNAGTITVGGVAIGFPASLTNEIAAELYYNGANWVFNGYIQMAE